VHWFLYNVLEQVVSKVKNDDASFLFRVAVNERDGAPGYYEIVKKPMHFAAIYAKCRDGQYTSVAEMMEDVDLIVSNCYAYNQGRNNYLLPVVDNVKQLVLNTLDEHKEEIEEIEQTMKELKDNGGALTSSTASMGKSQ
jgi:predicted DNA binding protein